MQPQGHGRSAALALLACPEPADVPARELQTGQEFAAKAEADIVAHGMWNGHDSTKRKLAGSVEPILQAFLEAETGYQLTSQVIRGLGAALDDEFFADQLLARSRTGRQLFRAATIENARTR